MAIKQALGNVRRAGFRQLNRWAERLLGVHVMRAHFYSPIPSLGELPPTIFDTIHPCVGLDFDLPGQLKHLEAVRKYLGEYKPPVNSGLSQVDAMVLYATIRERRPRLLIEVGSGESTKVSLAALRKNREEGAAGRMLAIEPFPSRHLLEISDPAFELRRLKVQNVPAEELAQADILFIDSSHVAKIGSDVNFEILSVVPRLKVGAWVHWHDIMIPVDYPRTWIESGTQYWNESYMVHAFMLCNHDFRVRWAAKYLQLLQAETMHTAFPYFRPEDSEQQMTSFWIERVS